MPRSFICEITGEPCKQAVCKVGYCLEAVVRKELRNKRKLPSEKVEETTYRMLTIKEVTFTKLRNGQWGLRIEANNCYPGIRVSVKRKDGSYSEQITGKVVWNRDNLFLCEIATKEQIVHFEREKQKKPTKPRPRRSIPVASDDDIPFDGPYVIKPL